MALSSAQVNCQKFLFSFRSVKNREELSRRLLKYMVARPICLNKTI